MWPEKGELIKIIVILFFALAAIVQMLFRTLTKPQPPGRMERPGGGPPEPVKDIREFLKEIRGGAAPPVVPPGAPPERMARPPERRRGEETRKVPVPSERGLVWEDVESPPRPLPPVLPTPAERGREEVRRPPLAPRVQAPAAPPPKAMSVHEHLEELDRRQTEREDAYSTVSEGPVPGLEEALVGRPGRGGPPHLRGNLPPPLIKGMNLMDAVLAQTILGPPRAREPFRRGRRGRPRPPPPPKTG